MIRTHPRDKQEPLTKKVSKIVIITLVNFYLSHQKRSSTRVNQPGSRLITAVTDMTFRGIILVSYKVDDIFSENKTLSVCI